MHKKVIQYHCLVLENCWRHCFTDIREHWTPLFFSSYVISAHFWIRNWSHITTYLVVLVVAVWPSSKTPKISSFQICLGWNLAGMFQNKYTSTDGVGFPIWCHTFKKAATRSPDRKVLPPSEAHILYAWHLCSSVCQFL